MRAVALPLARAWVCVLMALTAAFAGAPIRVDVAPRVAMGTQDVRVTTRVDRHRDNRRLIVVIDGPQFMRQDLELNADPASDDPRMHVRWFKSVPPGRYTVTSTLARADGSAVRSTTEFCLVGPEESCQ